jgi:hypothetical protein
MLFAYSHGLILGTAADKFSPNTNTTRGMIVTILHRMMGSPAAGDADPFSDVAADRYYTDAVKWAAANKIVGGYDGKFNPDGSITRQDLAVILTRYAEYKGLKLPAIRVYAAFSDDKDVSDYARTAIEALYKAEIMGGKPASSIVSDSEHQVTPQGGNLLDPKGPATRAELAALLHRFLIVVNGGEVSSGAAEVDESASVPNPKTGQPFSSSDAATAALIGATASGSLFTARRKDDAEPDEDEA